MTSTDLISPNIMSSSVNTHHALFDAVLETISMRSCRLPSRLLQAVKSSSVTGIWRP